MRLSLRARFALACGALVLVVASAVALAGYLALRRSLVAQEHRVVAEQADQLVRMIDGGGGAENGSAEPSGGQEGNYVDLRDPSLTGQLVHAGLNVVVLGPGGQAIQTSPRTPPGLLTQTLLASCRRTGSARATSTAAPATIACRRVGGERRPAGFIVAAKPLAEMSHTLRTTRRALAAGVLLGGLGSLLLAWLLARRGLRPLRLIARTAASIRQGDLSRRIGYAGRDELGELAAELDASFAELEDALRRQERFVADASHELKTPLAAARANVQLLRRWAVHDPGARAEALAALERSTARMARIVADLIQLAHGDDRLRYRAEPIRLDDLLLEAQREARALADGVEVVVERLEQAVVLGDRDRLQQVLTNLIDNALRVTPQGGSVRLALTVEGERVRISVVDAGPGIAPQDLPYVFERFFRGASPRLGAGSGLGLAIARAIVRAHGGEIEGASEPRQGSVFTVSLPCVELSPDRYLRLTSGSSRGTTVAGKQSPGGNS
jgi:two-component system, OmpR family, sensor kinase